jgi:flavoprotein
VGLFEAGYLSELTRQTNVWIVLEIFDSSCTNSVFAAVAGSLSVVIMPRAVSHVIS